MDDAMGKKVELEPGTNLLPFIFIILYYIIKN